MKLQCAKEFFIKCLLMCTAILSTSCEKDEGVQQKEFIKVTTSMEDLDKISSKFYRINNCTLNGKRNSVGSKEDGGINVEAKEYIDYSFELVTTIIPSTYVPVESTVNYSGSIPKSMFTQTGDGLNRIKISVQGSVPTLWVNNVKFGNQPGTGGGGTGSGGTGGGGGTGTTNEIAKERVEGASGSKKYVHFSLSKNAATLVIKTTDLSNADLNMADVFVSRGTYPGVTSNYPYKFTADYSHTSGNRGEKVITIKNAKAGDWHIMLYGFNSYFYSWVIVTAQY
jgi:hypothetical protein